MLKNIKSSYFIQKIFSYIFEEKKLKLVKYNKCFQKIININIINYIHFQGKYIFYESNEKGKERKCYEDRIIIEGECLNGIKNGK